MSATLRSAPKRPIGAARALKRGEVASTTAHRSHTAPPHGAASQSPTAARKSRHANTTMAACSGGVILEKSPRLGMAPRIMAHSNSPLPIHTHARVRMYQMSAVLQRTRAIIEARPSSSGFGGETSMSSTRPSRVWRIAPFGVIVLVDDDRAHALVKIVTQNDARDDAEFDPQRLEKIEAWTERHLPQGDRLAGRGLLQHRRARLGGEGQAHALRLAQTV